MHARRFALTLFVCAAFQAGSARADDASQLEGGITSYEAENYEQCIERFGNMLAPGGGGEISPGPLRSRARMYYAACLLAKKQDDAADRQMEQLVRDDTRFRPDRAAFPLRVLDRFNEVLGRMKAEIERIERERLAAEEAERRRREEIRRREGARTAEIERMAREETIIRQNSRWTAVVPFGVGQFQNGQRALGWALLGTEAALALASAGAYLVEYQIVRDYKQGVTVRDDAVRKQDQAVLVNRLAFGALLAVAAAGVVHAELTFVPQLKDKRERALPPPIVSPTAELLPGGAALGVGGTFLPRRVRPRGGPSKVRAPMSRFYVSTPIYYINAAPHVGSAYTTIAADALARYHRLRGHDTYFLTGTDEHGQKIEQAAAARGLAPKAFADEVAGAFRDAWPKLGIAPDGFIRTTDPAHEARVQEMWRVIAAKGDIYLGDYEGWYCVADEAFYTEKELVNGLSPTGRPVERVKEPSYFFRLASYRDRLLAFYEENPGFVEPEGRFNEVKAFVRGELFDLSVSRTTFTWGVPVPGDPKHVMYVWFDALSNYWTALGGDDDARRRFWPCDVHLVGKEITRFHAVYWPAFLMAAGLPLPKKIFAHGWLTVDGEKMSKSSGNVIDPLKVAAEVSADALRYYLLRAVSFGQDGDFSHDDLITRINSELGNDLGNLLNRTLGLCAKLTGGKVPPWDAALADGALATSVLAAGDEAAKRFDELAPHRALDAIWGACRSLNKYVDDAAPWAEAKKGNQARVDTILATLLEACGWLSIWIAPVMPEKSAEMRAQLALPPLTTAVGRDQFRGDRFQPREGGAPLALGVPLFPRIDDDRRAEILARLVPQKPVLAAPPVDVPPAAIEVLRDEATFADFERLDLRVGLVVSAAKVPKKDKLLDLRVDVGEGEPRRIVAGLALSFAPEALVGRRVIVVANLAPRDFGKGLVSHGMLLAAGPSDALVLADVPAGPAPGTRVK